ncbi:hypothetical protein A3D70_02065 [Candidatus Adlerbacteria bacterium RIFCSPHIGHO2_02_FULL_54_18]|uniref:Uncharacterized protein n=2 Tax=Candidatus Adleribacteriota TaxID=1752736 RepID=A0A1F4Y4W1_9BACT|nr:MAG: hypothetical protein A2949_01345 [Candidatus Adlerbacteria bacterium RIFCSPLOWO2_01_FULL_54_21b]OGC88990.1 MAG: hypothetical protein A3D70_02065 [Candidatus Adlerbacteria bacterium RIFCSPHIGHO2_02_FULL_54_18]
MILWRLYFTRVAAHFAALMVMPLLWWYWSKSLLWVIRWNTWAIGWLIQKGVLLIPDPDARHYATRVLELSDMLGRAIRAGLTLVPIEYRDQVEVLARVRYEPGGWLMVGQLSLILFFVWRLLTRPRRVRKFRKEPPSYLRKEPPLL